MSEQDPQLRLETESLDGQEPLFPDERPSCHASEGIASRAPRSDPACPTRRVVDAAPGPTHAVVHVSSSSIAERPEAGVDSPAPKSSRFAVLDYDNDGFRFYDGVTLRVLRREDVLAGRFLAEIDLLIVEAAHLIPQSRLSVAAPFLEAELQQLAANATCEIRVVPQRRTPRVWSECRPDVAWDERPKDEDTIVWHEYLARKERRLMSAKRWQPIPRSVPNRVLRTRAEIMEAVNILRQARQYPQAPVTLPLWHTIDRIRGRAYFERDVMQQRAFAWLKITSRQRTCENPYLCDAFAVACDLDGRPRTISKRLVRRVCGLSFNGYRNQVRSDLRLHLGRASEQSPTKLDWAFVTVVFALNGAARTLELGSAT